MDFLDKIFPKEIKIAPRPNYSPENYNKLAEFEKFKYDANIHLDIHLPDYVINLKFETLYMKDIDLNKNEDYLRFRKFLEPGLAFTAPFKVFSEEGVKVLREIVEISKSIPQVNFFTKRHPWRIRGIGYMSDFIRDLNECQKLAKLASLFAGTSLSPFTYFNYSHFNIGVPGSGKKVDHWHLDSVGFVMVAILSDCENMKGGDLQVLKRDRDWSAIDLLNSQNDDYTPEEILTVKYPGPGYAVFMQGSHIFHHVTSVKEATEPRISLIHSYMVSNCFEEDSTKFSTFKGLDPEHISFMEFARLFAWRSSEMLDELINRTDFDEANSQDRKNDRSKGKEKALSIFKMAIDELTNAYSLLNGEKDDTIGYIDPETKQFRGYDNEKVDS
ncbi:unnamed protein product [Brachionus calyciflorus]|uniref:Fe2OG dioxygenase domain-containing protein n=1 Tax=Brachionus calyciflorus TaxID=104777 RepID=A0A813RY89_9BILA|nr:unnamed protein product [Brachionus calyciflorus]